MSVIDRGAQTCNHKVYKWLKEKLQSDSIGKQRDVNHMVSVVVVRLYNTFLLKQDLQINTFLIPGHNLFQVHTTYLDPDGMDKLLYKITPHAASRRTLVIQTPFGEEMWCNMARFSLLTHFVVSRSSKHQLEEEVRSP